MQVIELTGLEAGELRAKVGSNIMDNTVISLTGNDIDLAPHLRHAGTLSSNSVPLFKQLYCLHKQQKPWFWLCLPTYCCVACTFLTVANVRLVLPLLCD